MQAHDAVNDSAEDPFGAARREKGTLSGVFQGEPIPMILRHGDVRAAAKDWKTFSSDAPFRVPIPSEEDVRSVRQLPIETDPPEHTDYRHIVAPIFRRPSQPDMIAQVESLVDRLLTDALGRASIEIVRAFALPLQSRALACLLNVPEEESDEWIGWGTHVFRDGGCGEKKGAALEDYIHRRLDKAARQGGAGEDFFSALTIATFRGRPLTRDEMAGIVNLTFAGGRDTVIHTVSSIIHHLAGNPEALGTLRRKPRQVLTATEEFLRYFSPLTHIGRVCPKDTGVLGTPVGAGQRISLCWASANRDETVFEAPNEMRLERRPNPHLAFGAGAHTCLGAAHTRLIVHSLLRAMAERVQEITVLEASPHVEDEAHYRRRVGFESLVVCMSGA